MADLVAQILLSGLTVGAMYALATLGLSMIWGALGMLNMAHGVMLTIGGYAAYGAVTAAGLPWGLGVLAAIVAGALTGLVLYLGLVRWMVGSRDFETTIIIATFGVAIALEALLLKVFGGQPVAQPLVVAGALRTGLVAIPYQNMVIIAGSVVLMGAVFLLLQRSRMGRAIRAVSQHQEAAALMGVPVQQVFATVLVLSGMLAAVSGVMLTSATQLSPFLGQDPMIKAFIMCVVAGLGQVPGAIALAFALALIEAAVQFQFGARWGFPVLLGLVIVVLILHPNGLFGRAQVRRL